MHEKPIVVNRLLLGFMLMHTLVCRFFWSSSCSSCLFLWWEPPVCFTVSAKRKGKQTSKQTSKQEAARCFKPSSFSLPPQPPPQLCFPVSLSFSQLCSAVTEREVAVGCRARGCGRGDPTPPNALCTTEADPCRAQASRQAAARWCGPDAEGLAGRETR